MELYTTFAMAKKAKACTYNYKRLARHLGGIKEYGKDTPISFVEVLDLLGLDACLWGLRHCQSDDALRDAVCRLFAIGCVQNVPDVFARRRPRAHLDAHGVATWAARTARATRGDWDAWTAERQFQMDLLRTILIEHQNG